MAAHGETVSVLRYTTGALDAHRNPIVTYVPGGDYPGCIVDPGKTSEPIEPGRRAIVDEYFIVGPAGMVIGPRDRVKFRGSTWNIQGEPSPQINHFTGMSFGVEFIAERIRG